MKRRALGWALEAGVPIAIFAAWWIVSNHSTSVYFPPLHKILASFIHTWLAQRMVSDVLPSLWRFAAGYALAAVLGVAVGFALGLAPRVHKASGIVLEFLRFVPPPALIPAAILILGAGTSEKLMLIAFGAVWPILLNTVDGVRDIHPTLRETALVYRLPRPFRLAAIALPAASPQIFTGLRVALPIALILTVLSEMVASTNGIGFLTLQAQQSFAIPEMWAGILLLGLFGYLVNLLFSMVEGRLLGWHQRIASAER